MLRRKLLHVGGKDLNIGSSRVKSSRFWLPAKAISAPSVSVKSRTIWSLEYVGWEMGDR
jgi:hypothetical protein